MRCPRYIMGILLWIDEGVNVIFLPFFRWAFSVNIPALGNAHYTVSQVLSEARKRGSRVGCVGCKVLDWVFQVDDHCAQAMAGVPEDIGMNG